MAIQSRMRSGISWFYWIAVLSLINSLIFTFGGQMTFVIGLAMTQFVDGFMIVTKEMLNPQLGWVVQVAAILLDALIAGIFALFGYLGMRGHRWAVILGIGLYVMDGLIYLAFGDIFPFIFHAYALFFLWRGLRAMGQLHHLQRTEAQPSAFSPA